MLGIFQISSFKYLDQTEIFGIGTPSGVRESYAKENSCLGGQCAKSGTSVQYISRRANFSISNGQSALLSRTFVQVSNSVHSAHCLIPLPVAHWYASHISANEELISLKQPSQRLPKWKQFLHSFPHAPIIIFIINNYSVGAILRAYFLCQESTNLSTKQHQQVSLEFHSQKLKVKALFLVSFEIFFINF
jgi:hypothetical protein